MADEQRRLYRCRFEIYLFFTFANFYLGRFEWNFFDVILGEGEEPENFINYKEVIMFTKS